MNTKERNATILLGITGGASMALALYALNLIVPVSSAITTNLQAIPEITAIVDLGVTATYIVKNL